MKRVQFSPVLEDDIVELIENIRTGDRAELWQLGRFTPEAAIRGSVAASGDRCAAAHDRHGALIAIFGVSPVSVLGSLGAPWMLGTSLVSQHRKELLHWSKDVLDVMFAEFNELLNIVWRGNTTSVRYLKALGFQFSETQRHPATGAEYYKFSMERHNV